VSLPKSPKTGSRSSPKKRTAEELSDLEAAFDRGELSAKEYLDTVFDEAPITRERFAGKRILSLDRVPPATIAAPLPDPLDVSSLLTAIGLCADGRNLLWASVVDNIPRRRMGAHLDWDAARVERAEARLGMRLHEFRARSVSCPADFTIRGDSRMLSFVENVGGRRCWSLTELTPDFDEIMAEERLDLLQKYHK
jgi:hypothetical protein